MGQPNLSATELTLLEKAHTVRKFAYAPYSNYLVGSALSTNNNQIFTGTNIENASYGLTICAERTAIFNAVANGNPQINTIAIVTKDGGMPCGACRQVMNEFNPDMRIITADETNTKIMVIKLSDLLPQSFGPHNLSTKD